MADEPDTTPSRGRRTRGARNKLKKSQEIDRVVVEQPFHFKDPTSTDETEAGSACYVSTTINNRRYYGILIEQGALQSASHLFFQDEKSGLDLNRRMQSMLLNKNSTSSAPAVASDAENGKRLLAKDMGDPSSSKRRKLESDDSFKVLTSELGHDLSRSERNRQIQKFRFVLPGENGVNEGYRELLATFASVEAAGQDDNQLAKSILSACRAGGSFVGRYYYQFEAMNTTLSTVGSDSEKALGMRFSMGIDTFLQNTKLPSWFPLSNLEGSQQKVLDMLNMKKDGNGNVVFEDSSNQKLTSEVLEAIVLPDTIPMVPRSFGYRVAVIGGGIAGLSSCLELLRECEREGIDVEVTLLEARNRLGGRLWTDRETFVGANGKPVHVDLGASWIHGIDQNPLAALANEAGVDFVRTSEEVKMLENGNLEVDRTLDERAGVLFDKLLDLAADESWKNVNPESKNRSSGQAAVRWYSSRLGKSRSDGKPRLVETPTHRASTDISVDGAIGGAIAKFRGRDFSNLTETERRMLKWNLKNVEYALGANISDLSMKFWDIDERHAFEGDHVMLKQGYTSIIEHLTKKIERYGDRFKMKQNFAVGQVEYARETTCQAYYAPSSRRANLTPLSDTCLVSSKSSDECFPCDFVVCAVPLGVLKSSLQEVSLGGLEFLPELPFSKTDAIESVGFGLLDKVYLQFNKAFWRQAGDDTTQYGNATGLHPHHYMFFDIGKGLSGDHESPAILMSLVSGREAVACEKLSEKEVVAEALETLKAMFNLMVVPEPIKFTVTRWGSDKFSRGSYTYLPPGTTDQDFKALQSAINGNGDSMLLQDEAETMRLFFAGEHTTALHPSMAHGALLSGVRAAKDVMASILGTYWRDASFDRVIPTSLYRYLNPDAPVCCSLCRREGTRLREGTLLAFKKGPHDALVHNNCAENSPEVEVVDGKWKDVLSACNRGKNTTCFDCQQQGATIGCADDGCEISYHFSCAEDTGWRFDDHGKTFFCDNHRSLEFIGCNRISMKYYLVKESKLEPVCVLCDLPASASDKGMNLVAFQEGQRREVFHVNCLRYTTVVDTTPDTMSRFEDSFRNAFSAIDRSRTCSECNLAGATIGCTNTSCSRTFHFHCCQKEADCKTPGDSFLCSYHNESTFPPPTSSAILQHSLSSQASGQRQNTHSNVYANHHNQGMHEGQVPRQSESSSDDSGQVDSSYRVNESKQVEKKNLPQDDNLSGVLSCNFAADCMTRTMLVRIHRSALEAPWNVEFESTAVPFKNYSFLSVSHCILDPATEGEENSMEGLVNGHHYDSLLPGDVILSISNLKIGSPGLRSVRDVVAFLATDIEFMVKVQRQI